MESALLSTGNVNSEEMKQPLQIWQLVISFVATIIACWGIIYMYNKDNISAAQKVENHEIRIQNLEADRQEIRQTTKDMNGKMDKLSDQNTQILIILQNKADRK